MGARETRRYILYVSGTQEQADDHVQTVASMLENEKLEEISPEVTSRSINKYGHSRGWKRNRLVTASGFLIDALGLNTAARGIKFEHQRPDLIIFDDLDDETDSVETVEKKIKMLTRKILPAGSLDVTVLGVQNLIHPNSIFTRFVDGRADFLVHRHLSGPHPAVQDLTWQVVDGKAKITGGTPTWAGLGLERCQKIIDEIGIRSFLVEHQHDVELLGGVYFDCWNEGLMTRPAAEMGIQSWWPKWISIDWGFAHDAAVHWHTQAKGDGVRGRTYTYREFVQNRLGPMELAEEIVKLSGEEEVDEIDLSPDAFAKRTDQDTIAEQMGQVFRAKRFPYPSPADNDRIGGWMLMYQLLERGEWVIAGECRELIAILPKLMRDEKNVEDVDKIDGDDAADSARYGLKTRLSPRKPPLEERVAAQVTATDPTMRAMQAKRAYIEETKKARPVFLRRGRFPRRPK